MSNESRVSKKQTPPRYVRAEHMPVHSYFRMAIATAVADAVADADAHSFRLKQLILALQRL